MACITLRHAWLTHTFFFFLQGRANADARANGTQHVPLVTKVKRTLGIQSRGRRPVAVDTAVRPRGRGLFSSTPRIRERRVEPERNRGWFSGSSGRYRT